MFDRKGIVAAALLACVAVGCSKDEAGSGGGGGGGGSSSAAAAVDTSTPKATATALAKALESGDLAAVRAVTVNGTEEKYQQVQAMSDLMRGFRKLNEASVAKFGDQGKLQGMGDAFDLSGQIAKAQIKEEGDKATVIMPDKADDKDPMTLVKQGGSWKVDMAKFAKEEEMKEMTVMAPKMKAALDEVTADLQAGKLKSSQEVMMSLGTKMQAAMGAPKLPGAAAPELPAVPTPPGGQ